MAFEIGERVTSSFTGSGTVLGELFKDEGDFYQRVNFDLLILGERDYRIDKLQSNSDVKNKRRNQ
jgi:hypothetical protein